MMSSPTNAGSASGSDAPLPMAKRCRPRNLSVDDDRQRADAADEVGIEPHRRTRDLELEVAFQDLLPQNFQLHLRQSIADTAMDAGAERQMLARPGSPDDEALGLLDRDLVAVSRDVPHHHLVAFPDRSAGKLAVAGRRAAHVDHRRLEADDLRHQAVEQAAVDLDLVELAGIVLE